MSYEIRFTESFRKDLLKTDKSVQKLILKYIKTHLDQTDSPRTRGKPLAGNKKGFWRYRIGAYRLIVEIKDGELIILCLNVGHRRNIYNN
ncbi:MAG: type II toxin-antitoxin system RelE/ParE family toxin [Clostridiaceae bacterium]|nr:type II toxin-antitoxin system RelE/ParE family toxin [Clostridiaceae bacterium]